MRDIGMTPFIGKKPSSERGPVLARGANVSAFDTESEPKARSSEQSRPQEKELGSPKTERDKMQLTENITKQTARSISPMKSQGEIVETRQDESEEQPQSLEMESLSILSLSKSSAEHLHKLMKSCVSKSDFERSDEGTTKIPMHQIDMSVKCANAITQIVQTNINLLKCLNKK